MKKLSTQSGFTIIELIVSLAIFAIVITITIGALLVLIATNRQLQAEQSVMTNLSFALDSMTREIRTGTRYFCDDQPTNNAGPNPKIFKDGVNLDDLGQDVRDCPNGRDRKLQGIAFIESGNSISGDAFERILYYYSEDEAQIFRRVGDKAAQPIFSSGISIEEAEFFVSGAYPLSDSTPELTQPAVTIYIKAKDKTTDETYEIQTTVTQRELDL